MCVCIYITTLGNPRASDHAPGGGAVGGGPHLHRGLPADLQDFHLKSYGGRQETAGVVLYGQPSRHSEFFFGHFCLYVHSVVKGVATFACMFGQE